MRVKNSNEVHVEFTGKLKEKFETLKKYYAIQSDTELIRVLINEKAQQLNANTMEAATNVR
jgi:hypothetical protein